MERYFSTDVLADILRRLPPSSWRRARLVCRHWRVVVNSRTAEMQSRASPLIWDPRSGVAYIIDDLSSAAAAAGSCRPLWRNAPKRPFWYGDSAVQLVGTCNGLLCLCDNEERAGSAVTVVNPATGEALAVPALPCAAQLVGRYITQTKGSETKAWHEAYSFAYHPTTGKYKVVHVPCSYERVCEFDAVHVLTLGEATWREVPVHVGPWCPKCDLAAVIVSVDGMTYWLWVTLCGDRKVAAFDLDDKHVVAPAAPLPPSLPPGHNRYHLTEVRGKLGVVTRGSMSAHAWVLEKGQGWIHRYVIGQTVPVPHFAYARGCVLTVRNGSSFYANWPKDAPPSGWRLRCDDGGGVVLIGHGDKGMSLVDMGGYSFDKYRTFAYVKTMEPL